MKHAVYLQAVLLVLLCTQTHGMQDQAENRYPFMREHKAAEKAWNSFKGHSESNVLNLFTLNPYGHARKPSACHRCISDVTTIGELFAKIATSGAPLPEKNIINSRFDIAGEIIRHLEIVRNTKPNDTCRTALRSMVQYDPTMKTSLEDAVRTISAIPLFPEEQT